MKKFILILFLLPVFCFPNRFEQFNPKVFNLNITDSEKKLLENKISFLTQAFIASGIADSQTDKYEKQYNELLNEIKKQTKGLNPYQTADKALQLIHKLKLKKYEAFSSTLDIAFEKGVFNCVSSSLLYNLILTDLGFETQGAVLKDHVFSQIKIDNKWIDAETTVLYGFDPGNKRETIDEFKKVTGFVYVPQSSRGKEWRNVTNRQYLTLVYSNRGAFLLENKNPDFALSLKLLYLSMLVSPDFNEGAVNLQAGYTQYSLFLKNQKRFEESVGAIQETLFLFPNNPDAKNNFKAVVFDWANYFFDNGKYQEGMDILSKYSLYVKKDELQNYYLIWSQKLLQKDKKFLEAMEVAKKAEKEFPLSKNTKEHQKYVLQEALIYYKKTGQMKEAIEFLNQNKDVKELEIYIAMGFSSMGKIKEAASLLEETLSAQNNSETHNAFVQVAYDAIEQGAWPESVSLLIAIRTPMAKSSGNTRSNYEGLFFQLGKNFLKNKSINDLKKLFKPFLDYPETETLALKSLGDVYYNEIILPFLSRQNYDDAIPHLKQAIEISKKKSSILLDAYRGARINHGISYYRQKNYSKAYFIYVDLIKEFPKDSTIRKNFQVFSNLYLEALRNADQNAYKKIKKEAESLLGQ